MRTCRDTLARHWLGTVVYPERAGLRVPTHEAVAIFLLMAYPFLGYIIASIRGGMLSPRFRHPVCFGFAIAATLVAYRLFHGLPRAGAVMLCFCLAWFIARESVVGLHVLRTEAGLYKLVNACHKPNPRFPPARPS